MELVPFWISKRFIAIYCPVVKQIAGRLITEKQRRPVNNISKLAPIGVVPLSLKFNKYPFQLCGLQSNLAHLEGVL
jgi:hypothetical protein